MFNKVVICTDLSAESDSLIRCAARLDIFGMREVILTYIVDVFCNPEGRPTNEPEVNRAFERQIGMLEDGGFSVHIETPLGHPAFSLGEICALHSVELLILGSYSKGIFGASSAGSTSSHFVQFGETPVFVIPAALSKEKEAGTSCQNILTNVLYCTDFSEAAERAFESVLELCRAKAERFTLLHIQERQRIERENTRSLPECDRIDMVRLARLREQMLHAGASDVSIDIAHGNPADELATRTASGEFSLVALGTRGRFERGSQEGFFGGVSDRAISDSRIPLLLVPSARTDTPMSSG